MPVLDLRKTDDATAISDLAHIRLRSVMLFPHDAYLRRKMLAGAIGVLLGDPKQPYIASDEQRSLGQRHSILGAQAGQMLLTLVQLYHHGVLPNLEKAVDVMLALVPTQPNLAHAANQDLRSNTTRLVRSPRLLRTVFQTFASVAHFWAAAMYIAFLLEKADSERLAGLIPTESTILPRMLPGTQDEVTVFVALADRILELFNQIPKGGRKMRLLHIANPWRVELPQRSLAFEMLMPVRLPDDL